METLTIEEAKAKLGTLEERVCFAWTPMLIEGKFIWWKDYIGVFEYKKVPFYSEEIVSYGVFTDTYLCTEGYRYCFKKIKNKLK